MGPRSLIIALVYTASLASVSHALPVEKDSVFGRVIDTGPGLATVVRLPGDHYVVYDVGHWNHVGRVMDGINEVIPEGKRIDLLVLSHGDSDHFGAVREILEQYEVTRVLRTGDPRVAETWKRGDKAIPEAHHARRTTDINLSYFEFPMGATYRFGDAYVTMIAGFKKAPSEWPLETDSERFNAISIIVRIYFRGPRATPQIRPVVDT